MIKRILALSAVALLLWGCSPSGPVSPGDASSSKNVMDLAVDIKSPPTDALVTSPLTIAGQARGTWFFEATMPVRLLEKYQGKEIARGHVTAQGEWMTTDFVPFTGTLTFSTDAKTGLLIVEKANPSGLPENDDFVGMDIRFRP